MTTYSPLFPEGMHPDKDAAATKFLQTHIGVRKGSRGRVAAALARALGVSDTDASHGTARLTAQTGVSFNNAGGKRTIEINDEGFAADINVIKDALLLPKNRPVMRDRSGNGAGSRW